MDNASRYENEQRSAALRKSEADERFLDQCNRALQQVPLPGDCHERKDMPFIFVVGPPRSGTTLAMQLLAHCLDVGYINNIMARFWGAPIHGARLSRMMTPNGPDISFTSRYGVTPNVTDPHEFGYFWSHWLGSRDTIKTHDQVEWDQLARQLFFLAGEFGRPMVFKNLVVCCHVSGLAQVLPRTVFIRVSRNSLDNALSIARARQEYYGDRSRWWSLRAGYAKGLEKEHWTKQIACQLHGVQKMLDASLTNASRVVEWDYEELCEDPQGFIKDVRAGIEFFGTPVAKRKPVPKLQAKTGLSDPERERMVEALGRYGLKGEVR